MFCSSVQRVARYWMALAFGSACALANVAPAAQVSSSGKHCLWRITNASAPFYLLGSVHALRPSDYHKTPVIEQAIAQSQQFFFEIDPKEHETFGKKLVEAAKYPHGVQIKERINPKTYAYLRKITVSGLGMWQHLHPWAIAVFLLHSPGYEQVSMRYGIDNYVARRARYYSKPAYGLETADEHVHVLSDMHDIEGEVLLLQSLVHGDEGPKRFQEEVAAWKTGDTERLYAMQVPRIKEAPTVWWRLLDHRNAKWIPKIETAIKSRKPTMVVAGTLHFCGPHSVVAMLKARGYKIEQL
jgi:uncharacterized protein YbaP (TraB family)